MGLVGLGKEFVFHTRGNGINIGQAHPVPHQDLL